MASGRVQLVVYSLYIVRCPPAISMPLAVERVQGTKLPEQFYLWFRVRLQQSP